MTIGQRLRAAREEKGMSIGDVARRTCIQPKFLHALDEDNLGLIPDSHRKLFVREYAKALELDPAEFLSLLPDYVPVPAPPPQSEPAHPVGARVISTAPPTASDNDRREYREILQRLSSGKGIALARSNTALWLIVGACLLMAAGALYYFFIHTEEPDSAGAVHAPADTTTAATPADSSAGGIADTAAIGGQPVISGDSLTLEGRATAPVWYSIVMDGKRSEQGTLDSGGTKVWRAAETFRMSLGNAGGLSLTLNDKPIGTLGLKKTIVRNQLIDATGIVKKGTPRRATPAVQHRPSAQSHAITPTTLRPAGIPDIRGH